MKILRTASLGLYFTGSYRKKSILQSSLLSALGAKVHECFSVMASGNDYKYCNPSES